MFKLGKLEFEVKGINEKNLIVLQRSAVRMGQQIIICGNLSRREARS